MKMLLSYLRRLAPLAMIAFVIAIASFNVSYAKNDTPEAFLHSIYDRYTGDDEETATGVIIDTDQDYAKYFTPSTTQLILDDDERARKADEVPALDGDAFIDAQEWNIKSFDITVRQTDKDTANATVTFTNYGKEKKILLSLIKLKEGWRIQDIVWNGDEGTLRGLYEKKKAPNAP